MDVGVATPEVKGTSVADEAPEKAAGCEVALATGVAVVMLGFRTLSKPASADGQYSRRSRGENLLVDDVHDTVGDQDIRHDDLGGVDEHGAVDHGDGQTLAVHGFERGAVLQGGRVADGSVDDVVLEDAGDLLGGHVRQGGADGLEGGVVRGENGHVLGGVERLHQLGVRERSGERSQVGGDGGGGHVHRDGQEVVDDVDHAAGEVHILRGTRVSVGDDATGESGRITYGLGDGGVGLQAREEGDVLAGHQGLDALTAGDVGVRGVVQHGRDERGHVADGAGAVGAVEDVVHEQRLDHVGVVGHDAHGTVGHLAEGHVRRCEDGDVGGVGQHREQLRVGHDSGCEARQVRVGSQRRRQVHRRLGGCRAGQSRERKMLELHVGSNDGGLIATL